jgi:hypothetical protein
MYLFERYLSAARARARRLFKTWLLHLAPTVTCERCGQPLGAAFPVLAGGRLYLYGIEDIGVTVEWSSKRTLRFTHEAKDLCRRDRGASFRSFSTLGARGESA